MKYGASTFIWVSPFCKDTYYLFDKVQKMGFDALEVCVEDMSTINAKEMKQAADAAGVGIRICGAFGPERDITSEEKKAQMGGIDYIKFCVDAAAETGSEVVSGPMYAATGKCNLLSEDEKKRQWELGVQNLRIAADYAKAAGVKLAMEPLNRYETDFINTVEQGNRLIDMTECSNLGFLLDTYHMNIEEKDMAEAIRQAGGRIFNFHACANDRGVPGSGHIEWSGVKKGLLDAEYDGYLTLEAFTPAITEIARAVSMWRSTITYPDQIPEEGIRFLKSVFE